MDRIGIALLGLLWCGCASAPARVAAVVPVAADPDDRCAHGVPCEVCVRCHPALVARFKAAGDWCEEHGVPETQCGICHPEVVVPAPHPPPGADVQPLSAGGADVTELSPHVVAGKVTIFDFHAEWCGPCRRVDEHLFALLATRQDVALRKLDIVSWESPLARHYLAGIASLPYAIVYGRDGRRAGTMVGLHLDDLDRAIAAGSAR